MRGKQIHYLQTPPCPRLIPAHAGKTPTAPTASSRDSAHPRSRGENSLDLREVSLVPGSSPLTRGKPRWRPQVDEHRGLLPAHAGKTDRRVNQPHDSWAHPRSHGENKTISPTASKRAGSSPLTRGKRLRPSRRGCGQRLIPAHAGKTCSQRCGCGRRRAHPRSRGENLAGRRGAGAGYGSSPLTRGKRDRDRGRRVLGRLIPAHAGETGRACFRSRLRPAHPRSRGENEAHCLVPSGVYGSSPLTRGKHPRIQGAKHHCRLIPAHAGKTAVVSLEQLAPAAHPRSRGENLPLGANVNGTSGSSPLTRGKLAGGLDFGRAGRLIPAHAGKTL